jgi:hypothetical protein
MDTLKNLSFSLFVLFFFSHPVFASPTQNWIESKGEHFIVYSTGDKNFSKDVLSMAEVYYRRIASDLGYPRHSGFWTWDKRVRITVYPDQASFLKATGEPDWSAGMADYKTKEIISYEWSKDFLESLLPHEIAHLIFRDFVQFEGEVPLWLDEGVAQWEEKETRKDLKTKAKQLYDKDSLLSINDLIRLNIKLIDTKEKKLYFRGSRTKSGKIAVLILSPDVLINTYYIEGGSLVGFLIETYGIGRFSGFCREFRDGKTFEEALRFAYSEHFQSIRELEDEWRNYLEKDIEP